MPGKLTGIAKRLANTFKKDLAKEGFEDELQSHLEMQIQDNLKRGMPYEEARRQALLKAGGMEQARQAYIDQQLLPSVDGLLQDTRFALLQLRKKLGFSLATVAILSLGIGFTTGIYSIIDGILLKPFAIPHPEQLVAIYTKEQVSQQSPQIERTSYPDFLDWKNQSHSFTGLAAMVDDTRLISRPNLGTGKVLSLHRVSSNYFNVLGIRPLLGRTFTADEDQAGKHIAILDYSYWQQAFNGDPEAVGAKILISDVPHTVIGVMPRNFAEPSSTQAKIWTTLSLYLEGTLPPGSLRITPLAAVIGRLRPGVSPSQAQAELSTIQGALSRSYAEDQHRNAVFLHSRLEDVTGWLKPKLFLLSGASFLLLLIVCSNVAGLMLSRSMNRRSEIALRLFLGASRRRIWQQLLCESLVLGTLGCIGGIFLAIGLLHIGLSLIPGDLPRLGEIAVDRRVCFFAAIISISTSILSNVIPIVGLSKSSPLEAMRDRGKNMTRSKKSYHAQHTLVVAQTALGVILLVFSGLFIRGLVNAVNLDPGFRRENLLTFNFPLTAARYPDEKKVLFYQKILPQLSALPGVLSATGASPLPFGNYSETIFAIDGKTNDSDHPLRTRVGVAEPQFFETLGVPLLLGRTLTASDDHPNSPFVTVVNQAFVRRYFPGRNPIGHRIRPSMTNLRNQSNDAESVVDPEREIVGVVGDFKQESTYDAIEPLAVFPYAQASMMMRPSIVLRVSGDPMKQLPMIRKVVAQMDPTVFPLDPHSMLERAEKDRHTQQFDTVLISTFSSIALLLGAVGLYSTLALMVLDRMREIGLRVAIGANRADILLLILRRARNLVLLGFCVGGFLALTISKLLSTQAWTQELMFHVSWFDPKIYLSILFLFGTVLLCACIVPSWQALQINPIAVLKED